jgi:hypothetical protein
MFEREEQISDRERRRRGFQSVRRVPVVSGGHLVGPGFNQNLEEGEEELRFSGVGGRQKGLIVNEFTAIPIGT